ncbi:MAG: hypothetical protein ACK5BN_02060 [Planctomycetota bacterium]
MTPGWAPGWHLVAAGLLAAAAAPAQIGFGVPFQNGYTPYTLTPQGQAGPMGQMGMAGRQPGLIGQPANPQQGLRLPGARNPFQVQWGQPQSLQLGAGFPVFPSQLSALFGVMSPSGAANVPGLGKLLLPSGPAPAEPPGWPAWVRTRGREPLPFAPDVGLLIRHAERVWWRPDAGEPFVPLAFHDKLRTLSAGAEVEVRSVGEFELLLHSSTRLSARGPTQLRVQKLGADDVVLIAAKLTWLRFAASGRSHDIELPGGHRVRIAPPPPATVPSFLPSPVPLATALPGVTDLVLARADEPGWLGGRATISNLGTTEVTFVHATGEIALPPRHRLAFFLATAGDAVPTALTAVDVEKAVAGPVVVYRAETAGKVAWSGAEFSLPPGARLRLDPQQGAPFAPLPAAPAAAGASPPAGAPTAPAGPAPSPSPDGT